jgi:hypothetical protein
MHMHINWTMVLISAICQWVLGVLWYGLFFRKSWTRMVGLAEREKPKNSAFAMIIAFIACLLLSFVMAHIDGWAGANLFTGGAKLGIICWVGFIAPPLIVQHIFEGRRANLFAINACYWLLVMAIGGGLLAAIR